ncbi:MAG: agmatinase [bacterium]
METLPNFGALPPENSDYQTAKIVILPVPFDKTTSYMHGTDKGPDAIIAASAQVELYDLETNSEVYLQGIHTAEPVVAETSEELNKQAHERVTSLLVDGKFVLTLGGEHAISNGPIKAHADFFRDISVLQLDAHGDMRDSYEGSIYSHASVMARVKEMPGVNAVVQVGIRAVDSSELKNINKDTFFPADQLVDGYDWIDRVVEKLSDKVYISLDIDVFDSSIMPSTGTPEPGGLNWYQVVRLLRRVAEKRTIVGADVVELLPNEANQAPDFLTAKLVYKLLSYRFAFGE